MPLGFTMLCDVISTATEFMVRELHSRMMKPIRKWTLNTRAVGSHDACQGFKHSNIVNHNNNSRAKELKSSTRHTSQWLKRCVRLRWSRRVKQHGRIAMPASVMFGGDAVRGPFAPIEHPVNIGHTVCVRPQQHPPFTILGRNAALARL